MELVYLWVEGYKNIKKQGFNFSPRFKCEFKDEYEKYVDTDRKEKERLKDYCELIIDEKKDYVSIFPENINITAIVGENGSGKSSISSFLFNNINNQYKSFGVNNYIFILLINKKKYIFSTVPDIHSDVILILEDHVTNKRNKTLDLLMNSLYSSLYDFKISTNSITENKEGKNDYFPNRFLDFKKIAKLDSRLILNEILLGNKKEFFTKYFSPLEIKITTNLFYSAIINKKDKKEFLEIRMLSDDIDEKKNNMDSVIFVVYTYLSSLFYENFKDIFEDFRELKKVSSLKVYREVLINMLEEVNYFYTKKNVKYPNIEIFLNELNDMFQYTEEIIKNKQLLNKIFDRTEFYILHDNFQLKIEIDKVKEITKMFYFFENLPECFDVSFIDSKKGISNDMLSAGEKSLLRIRYYLESIIRKEKKQFFIILFDEVENEMHPQWQAKLLKYLIDIFKNRNIQIHFILNSHSPFLLSDLPKENVIFLKDGKQAYPFKKDEQTFGANIHTLLSHGFFMKDGLIGEFAKDKIQSILKYHEEILEKELTKEENKKQRDEEREKYENEQKIKFWQIQSIIGDEYLKQVVKNHLIEIEKIVLGNDEAKDEEIKRLEVQIEQLRK